MQVSIKQNILIAVILLISSLSFSQHEFLVTVNPATGTFSKIDSLSGVYWIHTMPRYSTFDAQNQHYIFRGEDINHISRLYSFDASNGDLVSNPLFPILSDPSDNLIELQFDGPLNTLFGLHWDDSEQTEYLVSINTSTGQHTIIDSIPNVHSIVVASSSYDPLNHRYLFRGQNDDGSFHNYVIDVNTGDVVADPDYVGLTDPQDNISLTCYDYNSGKLYGAHWDNSNQKEYLVSIDPYNGQVEVICEIPGVHYLMSSPNYNTYDSNNHRFFFMGLDNTMHQYLYTIDTQLGQVISSPSFPVLSDPNDNVIELVYDNTSNRLFGLHWDNFTAQLGISENSTHPEISVYPNPFADNAVIKLNKEYHRVSLVLFDSSGKMVREQKEFDSDEILISGEKLPAGHYFVSINADNMLLEHLKVLIK